MEFLALRIRHFRRELSELEKCKKPSLEKFLIFREMELSSPKFKKTCKA